MNDKNTRVKLILSAVAILLMIPLIAMQFSSEVNWTLTDFLVAGILLFGAAFTIEIVFRKIKKTVPRILIIISLLIIFLLIWAELAVGIFGTPLAGS